MGSRLHALTAAALLGIASVSADEIKVGDAIHKGVHVSIQAGEYVIRFPDTGKTERVSTKRKDVKMLATSPAEKREALLSAWRTRNGERAISRQSTASPAARAEPEPEQRISSTEWQAKKAFEDTVLFETQLLLWAQLPPEFREQLMTGVEDSAYQSVAEAARQKELLQAQREQNNEVIAERAEVLEDVRSEAARVEHQTEKAIGRSRSSASFEANSARNSSGAYWPGVMSDLYHRQADRSFPSSSSSHTSRAKGNAYGRERDARIAAAESEARHIENEQRRQESIIAHQGRQAARKHHVQAGAVAGEIGALEEANNRARAGETRLHMQAEKATARAERRSVLLGSLEDALANGYSLTIPFKPVLEMSSANGATEASKSVGIRGEKWRVYWGVAGAAQGMQTFSISVTDVKTGRRIGGSTDNVPAYRRYLLLDGPGEFTIEVSGLTDSDCAFVVEEMEAES